MIQSSNRIWSAMKTIVWLVLLFCSWTASSNNLNGAKLKLSTYDGYPFDILRRQPDGNYTYTGSTVQAINWLATKLNFTYTLIPNWFEDASRLNMTIIDLVFKRIVNKEADGAAAPFVVDPERAEKMDYTFFLWTEPYSLIVPKPQPMNRLFAFIRPFQPIVWLYTGFMALLVIGMMCCFSRIYQHNTGIHNQSTNQTMRSNNRQTKLIDNIGYHAVYVSNILTNHGMYISYAQHSFRILAAGWLLATLVLVNSYSSIVVSSLTVALKNPPINSFEDLAVSNDVAMIVHQGAIHGKQIMSATTGVLKILGDSARAHPDRLFNDLPSTLEKLKIGHYAFSYFINVGRIYVTNQYKQYGKCLFLISDPLPMSSGYFSLLMQKGSPYIPVMNFGLIRLWETGLNGYWVRQQTPATDRCTVTNEKRKQSIGRLTKIKLEDLTGAFFILGIGLGAAVLSYLIEIIISRVRSRM